MFLIKLCTTVFFCLLMLACDNRPDWTSPFDAQHTGSHDDSDFGAGVDTRYLPTINQHYIHSETKKLMRYPVFFHQMPNPKTNANDTDNPIVPAITPALGKRLVRAV